MKADDLLLIRHTPLLYRNRGILTDKPKKNSSVEHNKGYAMKSYIFTTAKLNKI